MIAQTKIEIVQCYKVVLQLLLTRPYLQDGDELGVLGLQPVLKVPEQQPSMTSLVGTDQQVQRSLGNTKGRSLVGLT